MTGKELSSKLSYLGSEFGCVGLEKSIAAGLRRTW